MIPVFIFRLFLVAGLVGAGYCAALGHWQDVVGWLLLAGFVWVILRDLARRALREAEEAADARAVRVAKVRVDTLLDIVDRDAPVAMRIGREPADWLRGARWALDAARKVIKDREL